MLWLEKKHVFLLSHYFVIKILFFHFYSWGCLPENTWTHLTNCSFQSVSFYDLFMTDKQKEVHVQFQCLLQHEFENWRWMSVCLYACLFASHYQDTTTIFSLRAALESTYLYKWQFKKFFFVHQNSKQVNQKTHKRTTMILCDEIRSMDYVQQLEWSISTLLPRKNVLSTDWMIGMILSSLYVACLNDCLRFKIQYHEFSYFEMQTNDF